MRRRLISLPKDVADLLGDSLEEIERNVHEIIVLELYRRHTISAGRAAQLLDMEKFAVIRWTGEMGDSISRYDP